MAFVLVAVLFTWNPILRPAGHVVAEAAKRLLVVTLFLIGSSLSKRAVQSVGFRPFILGILLWACVASATLAAILHNII